MLLPREAQTLQIGTIPNSEESSSEVTIISNPYASICLAQHAASGDGCSGNAATADVAVSALHEELHGEKNGDQLAAYNLFQTM